jgi:hypothetical protein
MMMELSAIDVQTLILELTSEDEYLLAQLLWAINGLAPGADEKETLRAVQAALTELLTTGQVELNTGPQSEVMALESALQAVVDPKSWDRPASWSSGIWALATEAGERRYHTGNA